MKVDGRLDRNFLAGARGDAINALLCGAGYNLSLILNHLRRLLRALLLTLAGISAATDGLPSKERRVAAPASDLVLFQPCQFRSLERRGKGRWTRLRSAWRGK